MLDLMRRQSYLIYLVFGGIIVIFAINFGPGSSGCMRGGQQPWAAKVDGQPIRQQDFVMLYSRQIDYMRRLSERSGRDFDPAMAERMGLRKQVVDQLVERRLLSAEAEKRGLLIGDDELIGYLREQYGVKDVTYDAYQNWVTHTFDTNVGRFEDETRSHIAARRMAQLMSDSLDIGDDELKQDYLRAHDRAMVHFARFAAEPSKIPSPAAADIDALLTQSKSLVEAEYNRDNVRYTTQPEFHVAQILRKLAAGATEEDVAAAQAILAGVADKLSKGGDFAALAAQFSQDEKTAQHGGDLGWVSPGTLASSMEEAVANLQPGAIGPAAVRSPLGLHLVRLLERKDPQKRPLTEVERQVAANILRDRRAVQAAKAEAESLLGGLKAGKSWNELTIAEDAEPPRGIVATKPVRRDTPWVTHSQEGVSRIGVDKDLRNAIFELTDKQPIAPKVYSINGSFYVVGLKEREYPDVKKFADNQEDLREEALSTKRNRVLHDWLVYLRAQAKVQMNPGLLGSPEG